MTRSKKNKLRKLKEIKSQKETGSNKLLTRNSSDNYYDLSRKVNGGYGAKTGG